MSLPNELLPVGLLGSTSAAGGGGEYTIERSVRFNSSDSAYLSRDFTTAGNRKAWTWSGWVKRSLISSGQQTVFGNYDGASGAYTRVGFQANDVLWFQVGGSGGVYRNITSAVYRDPGAWLHLVAVLDTTQATASNRVKLWVNGELQTFGTTDYPPLNYAGGHINQDIWHAVGAEISDTPTASGFFNGYLADVHFIDGQALDPTSFGEFDANGVWQPKAYEGSYGTNGFHLDFSDNSTAAALGTDTSGNGNTWTVNNITAVAPSYGSPTNANTPAYEISIGPTNPLSGTYVWSNAFDANGSTIGLIGPITFNGTKPTWSTSAGVEVMAAGNGITAAVNGGTQIACTNGGWTTISSGSSGTLNSIWVYSSTGASYFYGVRVDGVDISVKALLGSASDTDSLVDVPTNGTETDTGLGGEVRGNYATLNPLDNQGLTLANGNLDVSWNASSWYNVKATIGVSTGKWYYEYTVNSGATYQIIGLFATTTAFPAVGSVGYMTVSASGWGYQLEGSKSNNNSFTSTGTTAAAGDVIIVAFDMDAAKVWFGVNGVWLNSGDPATGANAAFSNLSGTLAPAISMYGAQSGSLNFGARSFAYTAPSGFKALCTANLPAPVVTKPSEYMDVVTYTGNGSTQTISGLEFSPDLVWIKGRSVAYHPRVFDTVRGTGGLLYTSLTEAETAQPNVNDTFSSFNSDGFSLGVGIGINQSNATYVAWTWDAGSSTVTNTDGSITSQVRANASAGFSVVSGEGNTYFGGTLGHGLGVAPEFILAKDRDSTAQWYVYHKSLTNPNNYHLILNSTSAQVNYGSNLWNVTSTTIASNQGITGRRGVYYCFAPVDGYSSFGSYTGNGSANGTFVFTNHRPRWILLKRTDTTSNWTIIDTAREGYNVDNDPLYANLLNAEGTTDLVDILSNGFKLRSADASVNANAGTYIYASFAESPFQYSRAR